MADEDGSKVRKAFRLTGRVQGVGFRWWTRKNAQSLGLRGTVRNRRDGSVEIHAEGPEEAMSDFTSRLDSGPGAARVEEIEEIPSDDSLPDDFRIVR